MWSAPLNSCKSCARSVAGAVNSTGGTNVMDDKKRADGVHLQFAGEKLQSPLRFSGPGLWSNLDHQVLVKIKILVSVETPGADKLDHLL